MKRGDIQTLRDNGYASKARPVVIVQSDSLSFDSIILCLLTSFESDHIATRVLVEPTRQNGLTKPSYVMTDKIVTVNRQMLGERIGEVTEDQMNNISKALSQILGIDW